MGKLVTFDELIVSIRVPADLPDPVAATLARALKSKPFLDKLRRAARKALPTDSALGTVRVRVSW